MTELCDINADKMAKMMMCTIKAPVELKKPFREACLTGNLDIASNIMDKMQEEVDKGNVDLESCEKMKNTLKILETSPAFELDIDGIHFQSSNFAEKQKEKEGKETVSVIMCGMTDYEDIEGNDKEVIVYYDTEEGTKSMIVPKEHVEKPKIEEKEIVEDNPVEIEETETELIFHYKTKNGMKSVSMPKLQNKSDDETD